MWQVMEAVGVERFSGVCSDSAGNTRKARALLAKEIPTLLDLPDCCHHLQNTSKDITKLTDFKGFISNLRKIVQYFRRSTKASTELTSIRIEDGVTRGLQSVGKTRFATVYWSAKSLRACLPSIRQLISSGKLTLTRKTAKFDLALLQEGNMTSMKFEQALTQYTSILAPIARAIKSLEATDATAADVFVFWLGIASTLRDLFARPEEETGISSELAQKITGIVNKRYKEIIDQAPTDVYFTTFFLHPSEFSLLTINILVAVTPY
ncbi:ribonuclease H-like domain-containing protein [Lenzites betulinus]|nr:ribonuclease H-like domain-containing protein [Lenzites betulinus]